MTATPELDYQTYTGIRDLVFDFRIVKDLPSVWTEKYVKLTSDISRFQGPFSYNISPYTREIIDALDPTSPIETVAVMKCAQSGLTQGVIIPGICYIISESPGPILFMAGDKELGKNSIETRLDPIIESAGISHLIRPNVIRKRNQRTGDTSTGKEFAGGQLVMQGTKNADKMRQFSVRYIFADDWEAAPRDDKKEGSTQKLVEGRATSYGSTAKKFYISTPAVEQTSNILPVYLKGDQRKWHWPCPHCGAYIPVEWRVKREDGTYGGIKWELDKEGRLIEESVHYECQLCGGPIHYKDKYNLNLLGEWRPTSTPMRPQFRSYYLNALIIPPGFTSWIDLVYEWLDANPQTGVTDVGKLKTFVNIRLGQTWKETGSTPRVNQLMKNMCKYKPGVVPDATSRAHGNGEIIMLTLACDLNGIMNDQNEDVRLDWELVAHSESGATYSVDHGSIGTFKRLHERTEQEKMTDGDREKWTYHHGMPNSVWPEFEKIMQGEYITESGKRKMKPLVTLVDTGSFTRLAFQFIDHAPGLIFGIKGEGDTKYKKVSSDTPPVKLSRERSKLFLLEVNQLKDELSGFMKLKKGSDGYQPPNFMNFPQSEDGKYQMSGYFEDYEGERRVEEMNKEGNTIGFKWEKKNSTVRNHFWDVRIYNNAARYIHLYFIAKEQKLRSISWAEFVEMIR